MPDAFPNMHTDAHNRANKILQEAEKHNWIKCGGFLAHVALRNAIADAILDGIDEKESERADAYGYARDMEASVRMLGEWIKGLEDALHAITLKDDAADMRRTARKAIDDYEKKTRAE